LIFSVFLIGVTIGRGAGGELSPYVLACGLAGMLAFMGLDLARTRRRERKLLRERRELVARLERHLANAATDDLEPWAEHGDSRASAPRREVAQVAE
jgi:hypothetical protein